MNKKLVIKVLFFLTLTIFSESVYSQVLWGSEMSSSTKQELKGYVQFWGNYVAANLTPKYNSEPEIFFEKVIFIKTDNYDNAGNYYQEDNSEIYFRAFWNGKISNYSSIERYYATIKYQFRHSEKYPMPPKIFVLEIDPKFQNDYDWLTFDNIMKGLDIAIKVKELFKK